MREKQQDLKRRASGIDPYESFCYEIFTAEENPIIKRFQSELDRIPKEALLRAERDENNELGSQWWNVDDKYRLKRAQSNGQPFKLYVEVLVVTDHSIYEDHQRYARSNDSNIVFLHMRTYFAHFINEVNQRFKNSFANDPDLRIAIRLKNFFFIKVKTNQRKIDFILYHRNILIVYLRTEKLHRGPIQILLAKKSILICDLEEKR